MPTIHQIANELRAISLALDEGEFIGTEDTLIVQFAVSKPTLRKAISILEHEDVVAVRRGLRGGLFAHRPKLDTVVRVAGAYLTGHPHSLGDAPDLLEALAPLLIDSVLRSPQLDRLIAFSEPRDELLPHQQFVRELRAFGTTLYEVADNLSLRVCVSILMRVGLLIIAEERDGIDREGQLAVQKLQTRLACALLAGDRETAIKLFGIRGRMIIRGLEANVEIQRQNTRHRNSE